MTTAIEELEKLAGDVMKPGMVLTNGQLRDNLLAIATSLRTEVRDGKRAAFAAGRVWANEWFAMPTADWQESTEAEALRRYGGEA